MKHTDINSKGWISALPSSWQPYALLMRLDRPIGTWLLLLPGWWSILLAGGVHGTPVSEIARFMILFAIGAVVMRGAGCVVNDLWDRDLDRKVERTALRPLASGVVSVKAAMIFLTLLSLIGFFILIQMNMLTVVLGVFSLCFIILYPTMKRITWWPQAFLGLTFNFGALMGWSAVSATLEGPAIFLYVAGFFWTLGYDTIYAHQDSADDMIVGIKSSALRLGQNSPLAILFFYGTAWVFMAKAFWMASAGWFAFALLAVAAVHLLWQWRNLRINDPACMLRLFRSNRDFGLIVALAALTGFFF